MNCFHVLLVDDESAILKLMRTIFELEGYLVTGAQSAHEALALLRQDTFDAVVTDLKMETPLAGFEVVRAAASAPQRPYIAIVTAFPVPQSEWKSVGADVLYVKGTESFRLPELLKGILQQRSPVEKTISGRIHAI